MAQHQMPWHAGHPGPLPSHPGAAPAAHPNAGLSPHNGFGHGHGHDASKKEEPLDWKAKYITPKNVFMVAGSLLLGMLSVVPLWNAACLLVNSNYVFWAGRTIPQLMLMTCLATIGLYAVTITLFFRRQHASGHTEQTIMMIANIFITLLGLSLMMISLPLTHQSESTYTNLLYRCEQSEQTHRLYEYSAVLQNIRAQPACAKEYSIETCVGYEPAVPYTDMLKGMENSFRCAGFCHKNFAPKVAASSAAAAAPPVKSQLQLRKRHTQQAEKRLALIADSEYSVQEGLFMKSTQDYPPTLFSDENFQASCEGMAARDMKNFAGDIGQQTFLQGLSLVAIAVVTGFLKIMGFCIQKP